MVLPNQCLPYLKEMIEKVLFNPKELAELKDLIVKVSTQQIPARKFREWIIEKRGTMTDLLLELFPAYNKLLSNHKAIETFGNGNIELIQELDEKNNLLDLFGTKLQELERRLQKEFIE